MSKGKARGFQAGEGRRTKPHGGVARQRSLKDVNFSIFQLMSSYLSLSPCVSLYLFHPHGSPIEAHS